MSMPSVDAPNPYVGLRPFGTGDAWRYFGRQDATMAMLDILHGTRLLPVIGSSGSGKSSLVLAGMIPRLQAGFLVADRSAWRIATMRPGDVPLDRLIEALLRALPASTEGQDASRRLASAARAGHVEALVSELDRLPRDDSLLIVIDQFEEIFAYRGPDLAEDADPEQRRASAARRSDATAFVDLLLALSASRAQPVFIVLTMRSDFLGECDVFHGLPEAMNRGRFLVPRMTRDELREAIQCPAQLRDRTVSPRLLDVLRNQLGDRFDRLPLLQHALQQTWMSWERDGAPYEIDLSHYEHAGTIEQALDRDADAALSTLGTSDSADVQLAERVFRALTDTDAQGRRVRRALRLAALAAICGASTTDVRRVLAPFVAAPRHFVLVSEESDPRIELTHESLLRMWQKLAAWAGVEAQSREAYRRLLESAQRYAKGEESLWRPPQLGVGQAWARVAKPTSAWAGNASALNQALGFLDASTRNRRTRIAQLVIAAVLAVGAVWGGARRFAFLQNQNRVQSGLYLSTFAKIKEDLEETTDSTQDSVVVLTGTNADLSRRIAVLSDTVRSGTARRSALLAEVASVTDSNRALAASIERVATDTLATQRHIAALDAAIRSGNQQRLRSARVRGVLAAVPSRLAATTAEREGTSRQLDSTVTGLWAQFAAIRARWSERCSTFAASPAPPPNSTATMVPPTAAAPQTAFPGEPAQNKQPSPDEQLRDMSSRIAELTEELASLRAQRRDLSAERGILEREANLLAQQHDALRADIRRLLRERAAAKSRAAALTIHADTLTRRAASLHLARDTRTTQWRVALDALAAVTDSVDAAASAAARAASELDGLQADIGQTRERIVELQTFLRASRDVKDCRAWRELEARLNR